MNESILETIKTMLGGAYESGAFDAELCVFINAALSALSQNGVGPANGFKISGDSEVWSDFLGDGVDNLEFAKEYVYCRVRLSFDPPSSSFVVEALKEIEKEYFWRAGVQASYNDSE